MGKPATKRTRETMFGTDAYIGVASHVGAELRGGFSDLVVAGMVKLDPIAALVLSGNGNNQVFQTHRAFHAINLSYNQRKSKRSGAEGLVLLSALILFHIRNNVVLGF